MSELHELCYLKDRPITEAKYVCKLKEYLKKGIPSTYTIEDAYTQEHALEGPESKSTTTPLHLICESIPEDATEAEKEAILSMIDELFLNGAGWCLTNGNDETPGCVLLRRGLHGSSYWNRMVDAGVRAELLFRKLEDPNVEFLEYPEREEEEEEEIPDLVETVEEMEEASNKKAKQDEPTVRDVGIDDPSSSTSTYLKTKLKYQEGSLVTDKRGDGVMMQWEEKLMQAGCDSLFRGIDNPDEATILNLGFGMGIIDSMIEEKHPTKHYICEAHPDVLKKMQQDGWMDKDNVVVLKGKWQDTIPPLLSKGVFFDGIYYDTYSEHYEDMLQLFDLVVGLLKPDGTFSFFNGLGADRLVCYEVYKKVVDIDLSNYGLSVKFSEIEPPQGALHDEKATDSVWKGIKRAYWRCPIYYHPEVFFA
ncbi:DEKNAAC101662 [Brettanomyces naardenensis]|uniref:Arginine N-methyltransferase 2 n=1 Tax=Brettanomyces naardenensis TaxID=13370 RepID=A0A448YJ11_BRENA|nr:DEKNAAC101662 [Brettanomyces naardenensis]